MADYPGILPLNLAPGMTVEPDDPVARTTWDQGPSRSRNLFTCAPTMVSVTWRYSRLQHEIFEAWHRYKIHNGADWFGVWLVLASGSGKVFYQAKFKKMWKSKTVNDSCVMWDVSAVLEISDRIFMSETTLDTYL
jgi:pyoverdine/dityrosine biosynthesis protein Dit1